MTVKQYTLPSSFLEICLKLTDLYSFNHDSAHFTADTTCIMHDWLQANCAEFIANKCPQTLWMFPLDYQLKPKMTDELKVALQTIWQELPEEHTNKVVTNSTKCLVASGGHFERLQ